MLMSALLSCAVSAAALAPLPPLRAQGTNFVDPKGKPVVLRGCNLGNWLMLEMWIFAFHEKTWKPADQHEWLQTLEKRFGRAETERLMDVYRSNWITARDWPIIKRFGMNVVRLPIDYRLIESPDQPMKLRKDAWEWIDKCVDQAERHGIYTILDLHGAPGGQSVYDHTGHSGQNKLWTDPKAQDRFVWVWKQMALRYAKRTSVAAYDLVNEPYGSNASQLLSLMQRTVREVRTVDKSKVLILPANFEGWSFYLPYLKQWKNVAITTHQYPGLFGNGEPTLMTHARHLQSMELEAGDVKKANVPYLVGEMNVVFKNAGGADMMRRTFDLHAKHGWATTMWTYKALSGDGGIGGASWGMVTNRKPARSIDLRTASKTDIQRFFEGFATEEYELYGELQKALGDPEHVPGPIPEVPKPVNSVPCQDTIAGWNSIDVNDSLRGGLRSLGGGRFELFGGGSDIWGQADQFRFLHRTVQGDFELQVTVDGLDDVGRYCKAGLMVRAGMAKDSAAGMLSTFASGELQFAVRERNGGEMSSKAEGKGTMPGLRMRLVRRGDTLQASYAQGGGEWKTMPEQKLQLPPSVEVGVVSLSHDNRQLVRASYRDLRVVQR